MFDLAPEEARLLLNAALLATGRNRFQSAAKILAALERFRPEEPSIPAAKAVLFISMRDFQGAVDYLDRDALPRFPGAPMLLAFKGMALLRMGRLAAALRDGVAPDDFPKLTELRDANVVARKILRLATRDGETNPS